MNILEIIGRDKALFSEDIARNNKKIEEIINGSSFSYWWCWFNW